MPSAQRVKNAVHRKDRRQHCEGPRTLALRGVLAGHPVQGSRAAGLAALSIATSRLYRAALMTVSAPAAHHQTNVTVP